MNAYAERFVRSLRQECLDHFVIFTENQLRRVVKSYIDYYNNYRSRPPLEILCSIDIYWGIRRLVAFFRR
jgi:transposase InsO family protein